MHAFYETERKYCKMPPPSALSLCDISYVIKNLYFAVFHTLRLVCTKSSTAFFETGRKYCKMPPPSALSLCDISYVIKNTGGCNKNVTAPFFLCITIYRFSFVIRFAHFVEIVYRIHFGYLLFFYRSPALAVDCLLR